MGLFSNKKNLCPFCGEPTPRLFPTKVEGTAICKKCDAKIMLPKGVAEQMGLSEMEQYMAFHDQNAELREAFHKEYTFDVDGWSDQIEIDFSNNLFRLSDKENAIVFDAKCIRSFKICEDDHVLYEGDATGMRCHESNVPELLERMEKVLEQYLMEKREYERMKALQEMMKDDDDKRPRPYLHEPRFDPQMPVEKYHVTIQMEHPYWPEFNGELDGPRFGVFGEPEINDYYKSYDKKSALLEEFAQNFISLFAPGKPVTKVAKPLAMDSQTMQMAQAIAAAQVAAAQVTQNNPAPAPQTDAISEIKKYKELMDAGIITEEEFAAKKRQLLGI